MQYKQYYDSPLGKLLLGADAIGLTGIWFEGQEKCAYDIDPEIEEKDCEVLQETREWLDIYFRGEEPDFYPPIHLVGSDFQKEVWELLRKIPYGKLTTYGEIAKRIAEKRGMKRMSAQAVGGAVGHNEISIMIPCHRVIGANGNLTGYTGGMEKKIYLLELEGLNMDELTVPKKYTDL